MEVCSLRDAAKDLAGLKVRVVGVSLDDVASQKRFAEGQKPGFPLLSDVDGSAASRYGVLSTKMPMAQRVTFVIDPKGVIRLIDSKVRVASHGKDLVDVITRLQAEKK